MKYRDRHTVKSTFHWQKSEQPQKEKSSKAILKQLIIPFSKKIDDLYWWNSLTQNEKIQVYLGYCNYWHWSNGEKVFFPIPFHPSWVPNIPDLSDEEHEMRINSLKEKYSDQSKRRALVINDILK